jgi:predicted nucleic-acid-binding Zn-ribbon protein
MITLEAAQKKLRLRCPKCFATVLRKGEGFPNKDSDMEVRSFDFDIVQCKTCGWSGDMRRFEPPKKKGVAVISPWTEAVV